MAEYPIYIKGKRAGRLWAQRQGLYTIFTAKACGTEPVFLRVYGNGKSAPLGRLLPRGGELFLSRRMTRNDMRCWPGNIEYAGDGSAQGEKSSQPQQPPPQEAGKTKTDEKDRVWYAQRNGVLLCPGEGLIALPAALRDKRGVLSRIRVINGKEYLVFRR
ncbi:MAG: hypothetical protein ACI3VA_12820 [Candidatus Limivicinus sp.]